MKTKRILAAILSALMLMSCVSFTAGATEEPVDGEISLFDFLGEEGTAAIEEAEEAVDEPEEVVDEVEETVDEPEEVVDEVEETVDESEEVVDESEEAVDEPEEAVDEVEETVEESEEPSEKSTKKTSKKVEVEEEASLMEEAELAAEGNTVYLSDNGDDAKDGLTAENAVKTIAKANAVMAANAKIDTLVIVDYFTASTNINTLGVSNIKLLTITGDDPDAVFRMDWPKADHLPNNKGEIKDTDDCFTLACPVKFENIALYGDNNDGRFTTNGHKIEFGTGVKKANKAVNVAVEGNSSNAQIIIQSGEFSRVFPGRFSGGTFTGNSTVVVDGAGTKIATIGLGHGWHQEQYFSGKLNVTINNGTVNTITIQASGTPAEAESGYRGLRYFTLNGGTVGNIVTTSGPVWRANGATAYSNIGYRTGVTVFEINEADIVTGTIDRGFNINGKAKVDDDATRIIIFNNNSYEAGKVLDTGAITVNVIDGALKADVTMAADYTTTLKGYTYETSAPYIKITTPENKTIYLDASNPNGAPAATIPEGTAAVLAAETNNGTIPADYLKEGLNVVEFVTSAQAAVMFNIEGEEEYKYQTVGGAVTFPQKPTKLGYSFKGWATEANGAVVDAEKETVAYAGNTYYAVFEINKYTITFNTDGGTEVASITQDYNTAVTAPADPTKAGYTFAGWDVKIPETMPANDVAVKATWEIDVEDEKAVYLSDKGDDANHGRHSDVPVKSINVANEIIKANASINTVVVVGYYTNKASSPWMSYDPIGVANRDITIVGDTEEAVFDWTAGSDCGLIINGNVKFEKITLKGDSNDGHIRVGANKLVFGDSIVCTETDDSKNPPKYYPNIVGNPVATGKTEVELNSGKFRNVLAGTIKDSTVSGEVFFKVNGGEITMLSLCKAYHGVKTYNGKFTVEVNGGHIDNISLRGSGSNAANAYSGLRYFTINGGTVNSIVTTSTNKYGANLENTIAANKRIGTTVFEINKKGALLGTAKMDNNVADESTRIIIFNNGSYEAGKVLDTGAITVNVINGALKADVTMADDYTTTLNGYTYETSAPYIKITTPDNKTIYLDASNPDGAPAATIPEDAAAVLAAENNKGTIPAKYLVAGVNEVEFVTSAQAAVMFNIEGEEEYKYQTVGGAVAFPEDPKKTGYSFKGWATAENSTEVVVKADEKVAYAGNTYYAVFEINQYTITFNTDGGTEIAPIKQDYDTTVTAPAAPTKTGYTFAGWETLPTTMPAENVTVNAKWTINQYTITFITDGSAVAPITQDYATAVTTPTTEKTGYTFTGWSPAVPETMPAENMTVTAQWQINQYTITFDTDGGSAVDSITQDYATAVTAPAAPVKTGYTFAGWNREIPTTIPAENITITALWTINQYTITFANTGDTTIDPIKQDYATAVTAPADPAKPGYTFAGWDKTIPATMPAEDMTITAQWTANDVGYVLKTYMMDKNGETYTLTETTVPAGNSGAITDSPFTYTPAAVEGFTLNTQKSVLTDDAVNADGTTLIELYYDRNVITIYYTVAGQTIEQVVKNDQLIDEDHHFDVEIKLPVLPDEVLDEIYEHQHGEGKSRKGYKFYWKKLDAVSGHLLEERNEALESNVYYLPGDNFTVPSEPVEFTAYWDYSDAELVLAPNASKAVANDHEFVFDIYLESAYSETLTKFESGEFTLDITTKDNTSYTYELTPNANITFEPDLDGRILVKRTDGNAAYLVPEKAPNGTDYRIYLGAVKVTGAGEGTVTLSKAVGYRHVVDGTDADHLAVEFLVKDASESYTVEVPTATLKVTVDFKNIVTDNVHEYQDMTMTISGGDLGEEIVIDLGKNASFAVPDLANRDGEAITAPALADGKYVVTLTNILAVNRTYNIKLEGAGYRSTRYTVSMTADKELYFWNNVMDNVTEIETGKPGTQVTFLAGDIVKDSEINIYDLSAVVSYFGEIDLNKAGTQSAYTKYDLNRDGKIDSKDVAYVLVSWGK